MASPGFDITPEREGSIAHFFYRQITYMPPDICDVDLDGQTAIVTGSNTGIGLEVGRQLLALGLSRLVLAVRNVERGNAAAEALRSNRKPLNDAIHVWPLDLNSYDSVVQFAKRANSLDRIDIVVLNAAVLNAEVKLNPTTRHEEMVQVNYLSQALLAVLLLPVAKRTRVKQSRPTRITIVSSDTAAWTDLKDKPGSSILQALDKETNRSMQHRYFLTKLLQQLFLVELAKRVPPSVAIINAATPGMCHDSNLNREMDKSVSGAIAGFVRRRVGYTCAVGARCITDAAVNHGEETHGQYLGLGEQRVKP